MNLKHANELHDDLKSNKLKKQLEYWEYAEKQLFRNIEWSQEEGETQYLDFPCDLSSSTIQKLKDLDYVVEKDRCGFYNIYWGVNRHKKKGWFS